MTNDEYPGTAPARGDCPPLNAEKGTVTKDAGQSPFAIRLARILWSWLLGAAACMTLLGSILAVGWTYRLMRRSVLREWDRLAQQSRERERRVRQIDAQVGPTPLPMPSGPGANAPGSDEPALATIPFPAWFIRERAPRTATNVFAPLWHNARIGVQALFNTYVLTAPACVAWLFAWRFGWDNSFHKVYEQYAIGISTWMLGNALFILAMLYVPLAQARQAATGDWRAFYGFRVVWALLRRRPIRWMGLAIAYALLGLPVFGASIAPHYITHSERIDAMTDSQLVVWLYEYYAWVAVVLFPAFAFLRLRAARLYAKALPLAVRRGEVRIEQLHYCERETLDRLGLLRVDERARRHPIIRVVGWTSSRFGRFITGTGAVLLWTVFAFFISLSAFISYTPRRWVNHPLIHFPSMTTIPYHLTHPDAPRDATDMGSSMTGA